MRFALRQVGCSAMICLSLAIVSSAGVGDAGGAGGAESVTISSSKDNTLIQHAQGLTSNGAGIGMFAGRVGNMGGASLRRAIVAFDVAANIPAGSTITSVTLQLTVTQVPNSFAQTFNLHRALADWGEGEAAAFGGQGAAATPGSVTWLHTFSPDQFWENAGGDYSPTISGSQSCGGSGSYTWPSTPQMVADVQSWLDDPASNFGWIIRGNEGPSIQTVKRFATKEWSVEEHWPQITVEYIPPGELIGDLNDDDLVNAADLALLLGAWSIPAGAPGCGGAPEEPCPADLNGDTFVNAADLAMLLGAWTL